MQDINLGLNGIEEAQAINTITKEVEQEKLARALSDYDLEHADNLIDVEDDYNEDDFVFDEI